MVEEEDTVYVAETNKYLSFWSSEYVWVRDLFLKSDFKKEFRTILNVPFPIISSFFCYDHISDKKKKQNQW